MLCCAVLCCAVLLHRCAPRHVASPHPSSASLPPPRSLLIFDGPGQGSTPYKPEHMPFYAKARLKLSSPPCCASPGMIHWLAFRRAAPARLPVLCRPCLPPQLRSLPASPPPRHQSEEYTRKVVDTALANPDVGPKVGAAGGWVQHGMDG